MAARVVVKSKEVRADSVARGFRKKKKNFQVRKAIPERSAHISTSPSLAVARITMDRENSQLRKELTVPNRDNEWSLKSLVKGFFGGRGQRVIRVPKVRILLTPYRLLSGGRGGIKMVSASTPSVNEPTRASF